MHSFIRYPQNKSFIQGKTAYSPKAPATVDFVMSFKFWGILAMMILLFFLVINSGLVHIYEDFEIQANGVTTQGIVSSVTKSGGIRKYRDSWLCYDFYVNDSHYDDCTLVKYVVAPSYPVGTVIDILYAANNPNISRFVGGESQASAVTFFIVVFVITSFLMSLMLIYTFIFIRRTSRFNNKGVVLRGRLDKFESQKVFGSRVISMTVTFRLPNTTTLVSGKKQFTVKHIGEKSLSPSETIVYILYVNKKMWEIL